MKKSKVFASAVLVGSLMNSAFAEEAKETAPIAQTPVPQIVLHDILTNRVCIYESKLYSIGAKVIILGKAHECTNVNPMTFGASDAEWDMRWMPMQKQ